MPASNATFARLDLDVRTVQPQPPVDPGPARDHGQVGSHYRLTDEWGMGWQMPVTGGHEYAQRVLPFGTPQEVRDETRRRIDELAPGGGFIFAPIHVLQADVPPENIVAW